MTTLRTVCDRRVRWRAGLRQRARPGRLRSNRSAGREPTSLRLQLADEIVRGALAPGTALDETELARRFERVAHTGARGDPPAGGERAGRRRAHRGAVVARPSSERLIGMFETMAELEALCAGLAAERMTADERRAPRNRA